MLRVVVENPPTLGEKARARFMLLENNAKEPKEGREVSPKRKQERWRPRNATRIEDFARIDVPRVKSGKYRARIDAGGSHRYESVNVIEYTEGAAKLLIVRIGEGQFDEENQKYQPCTIELIDDPELPLAGQAGFLWID